MTALLVLRNNLSNPSSPSHNLSTQPAGRTTQNRSTPTTKPFRVAMKGVFHELGLAA
jgi:hypothetical protein